MQEFANQEETAEWMGVSVEQMNNDHDRLHAILCQDWLVESESLKCRDGLPFNQEIAWKEEEAVMHVQRWLYSTGWRGKIK